MSFKNKVVLVTGSGSGIGRATAISFAKEGADVVIVDCNEKTANETADKCNEFGNKVQVIKTDVSKDEETKNALEKTIKNFGKLDILINNAGTGRVANLLSGNLMDTYDLIMDTNLRSVILMTSLAKPYLIKTKGCIVNTASIAIRRTQIMVQYTAYTVSKIGVDCFTRLAALELAPFGVRVNAVNPGPVYTNIFKNCGIDGSFDDMIEGTALKRCSDPQEIADLIVYLASDKAKSITGSTYDIDNGMKLL